MSQFQLDKLVRDGVFADMQAAGQQVVSRIVESDEEFLDALAQKLREEASEFDPKSPHALDELADIAEVMGTIAIVLGFDFNQIRDIQFSRRQAAGGFAGRVFVETVAVCDGDPWAEYYASQPDRFPEAKEEM